MSVTRNERNRGGGQITSREIRKIRREVEAGVPIAAVAHRHRRQPRDIEHLLTKGGS